MFLQYPGWWIVARFEYFTWFFASHNLNLPTVFVLQSIIWSVVWLAVFRARVRRAGRQESAGGSPQKEG